jgi:hypothetical protein
MKWMLLRWLLVTVGGFGLLLAGADGPFFPRTNLAGMALVAAAMLLLRRDPSYLRRAKGA